MERFYFSPASAPLLCCVASPSQLGSRSLEASLGRYRNSQVISHSLNSGQLKIPISFFFYKTSPLIQHHREGVCLACLLFLLIVHLGASGDGLASFRIFFLSLFLVCWDRKEKNPGVSYLTGVVHFLLVDCCCLPGCPSLAVAMWAVSWWGVREFTGELCGGFASTQSPKPEALHLASSPFLEGAGSMVPVQLSSKMLTWQWEPNPGSTCCNTAVTFLRLLPTVSPLSLYLDTPGKAVNALNWGKPVRY